MVKKTVKNNNKKKSKQPQRKSNVSRIPRAPRTQLSLRERLRRALGSDTFNYLEYVDGKSVPSDAIRPPVGDPRMISRWTTLQRFRVDTGTANKNAFILSNPYYADQQIVYRTNYTTDHAHYYATCWGNELTDVDMLKPTTVGVSTALAQGVLATQGAVPGSATYGNAAGAKRVVGMEITITPLSTTFNAGGEVILYHNSSLGGIAGRQFGPLYGSPFGIKRGLGRNMPIKFQLGFATTGPEFKHIQEWANGDDDPVETDHAEVAVFGAGEHLTGAATVFGANTTKGWDLGIMINSAAAAQSYDVTMRYHYEGHFKQAFAPTGEAWLSPPTTMAHPNPTGLAVTVSALRSHMHAQVRSPHNESIWPHVEAAAKHVLPYLFEAGAAATGALLAA